MTKYVAVFLAIALFSVAAAQDDLTDEQIQLVRKLENRRIETIDKVIDSVIAVYGQERQGGGSGVIIDPSGIGLTNHHVIAGAGVKGWGGLADGKLYQWDLIGTDPGGDVAIIQMKGRDTWPYTPLADSDQVQVGDWALAMGNPFLLTEDQVPTVTLGIVSGVKRYQPGAGLNQLVYGNCIQTDSSINPGNSGGPLFNLSAEVIGINGRGSFKERGRVNVGLGYAISANQIKNFIPELLATKLVEHGTLDANFQDRDGKVLCSQVYEDSAIYKAGLRPGDELLEFESVPITTANQYTNLICTLPEDWPAKLVVKDSDGQQKTHQVRLYGLPYAKPQQPKIRKPAEDQTPEEKEQIARMQDMIDLLSASPGTIRDQDRNSHYAKLLLHRWTQAGGDGNDAEVAAKGGDVNEQPGWELVDRIVENGDVVGSQTLRLFEDGSFSVDRNIGQQQAVFTFEGKQLTQALGDEVSELSLVEMKLCPEAVQAIGMLAASGLNDLGMLGETSLDGSDKASSSNSYRLKLLDSKEDAFYFWLSMPAKMDDVRDIRLLKAAASKDCEDDSGGIVFDGWKREKGLLVASSRRVVKGIGENVSRSYELESVKRILPDQEGSKTPGSDSNQ